MVVADDRLRCAHLLRRFGLGASESEIAYYLADGLNGAVDKLLSYDTVDEGFSLDVERLKNDKGRLSPESVSVWWTARLLMTRRPLQERMTLFWHDHFATSGAKVGAGQIMYGQNELLRKNATGNFRTLISEVSKDPAMILWLDSQQNVRGHANENFAREVMELFTLGIGHYTEQDVQEGARAFTGWSLQRNLGGVQGTAEFLFRPRNHDIGPKKYLGNEGNFDGDDILNILCDQPRTAEYITTKLWDWFVWPKPDAKTVAPFAQKFHDSGLDIKQLLRSIMLSDEFYSPKAIRAVVKSPMNFCVVTLRQMGVGEQFKQIMDNAPPDAPRAGLAPAAMANQGMKAMGMWLLYPPDVHGWDNGKAFINSQTMLQRISWAEKLFGKGTDKGPLRYDAFALFREDPTPDGVVHRLLTLFDVTFKPEHRSLLVTAAQTASGGTVTEKNANPTATAVSRLLFASPEFQMS